MTKKRLHKKVREYLAMNKLMTIGTSYGNRPWGATVFFAFDKRLNIYFYSQKDTRHCENIVKNPLVSVVVNQDWGGTYGIKGVQMIGRASEVAKKDYKRCYAPYRKRFSRADRFPDHTLYIVRPIELWYIDQKLFGHFYRVRIL